MHSQIEKSIIVDYIYLTKLEIDANFGLRQILVVYPVYVSSTGASS